MHLPYPMVPGMPYYPNMIPPGILPHLPPPPPLPLAHGGITSTSPSPSGIQTPLSSTPSSIGRSIPSTICTVESPSNETAEQELLSILKGKPLRENQVPSGIPTTPTAASAKSKKANISTKLSKTNENTHPTTSTASSSKPSTSTTPSIPATPIKGTVIPGLVINSLNTPLPGLNEKLSRRQRKKLEQEHLKEAYITSRQDIDSVLQLRGSISERITPSINEEVEEELSHDPHVPRNENREIPVIAGPRQIHKSWMKTPEEEQERRNRSDAAAATALAAFTSKAKGKGHEHEHEYEDEHEHEQENEQENDKEKEKEDKSDTLVSSAPTVDAISAPSKETISVKGRGSLPATPILKESDSVKEAVTAATKLAISTPKKKEAISPTVKKTETVNGSSNKPIKASVAPSVSIKATATPAATPAVKSTAPSNGTKATATPKVPAGATVKPTTVSSTTKPAATPPKVAKRNTITPTTTPPSIATNASKTTAKTTATPSKVVDKFTATPHTPSTSTSKTIITPTLSEPALTPIENKEAIAAISESTKKDNDLVKKEPIKQAVRSSPRIINSESALIDAFSELYEEMDLKNHIFFNPDFTPLPLDYDTISAAEALDLDSIESDYLTMESDDDNDSLMSLDSVVEMADSGSEMCSLEKWELGMIRTVKRVHESFLYDLESGNKPTSKLSVSKAEKVLRLCARETGSWKAIHYVISKESKSVVEELVQIK